MKNKIKAIICAINSKYIHSSLAPWYIIATTKKRIKNDCLDCQVVEGTINEDINEIANKILSSCPDILGICCYIWNISTVNKLISIIKEASPNTKIILGGPEVSYCAESILNTNQNVDFIISGNGEIPFSMLMEYLINKNTNFFEIQGLCYKDGSKLVISQPYIMEQEPENPYIPEYFDSLGSRIAYIESSRGCPYSCAFCLSGRCGKTIYFDKEKTFEKIIKLASFGAKIIKFVDRTFNANPARCYEIIKFIIDNYGNKIPNGVSFHFEMAGDILDDKTIILLNTAPKGAIQLEIGIQSFNSQSLSAIFRKTDINKLERNIALLSKQKNIHIHIDIIAGLPHEDFNSFSNSFNKAFSLGCNMLQLGFLKLLHGSKMREKPNMFPCLFNQTPPYEITENPYLSSCELKTLHNIEDALERIYNSGRFNFTLEYVLSNYNKTPFDLFYEIAMYLKNYKLKNISLESYSEKLFNFFCKITDVDKDVLRDKMVCDQLSSVSSGVLPKFLRREDPRIKKIKKHLFNEGLLTYNLAGKTGVAILYSESVAVYVDYTKKDPVTKRYSLKRFPM